MVVTKPAVFPRMAKGTKYNNISLIDKKMLLNVILYLHYVDKILGDHQYISQDKGAITVRNYRYKTTK